MTPDERKRLEHVEALMAELSTQVTELHDAFFQPAADGSPPLIRRISRIVLATERSEWAMVLSFRFVAGLAGLIAAVAAIKAGLISYLWPK
ncbi:MAG: hypothetical protein KA745_00140 [Gemmatimonadales bacterium]|nr:hypothetical protein [Gemmatimonadales bacterium]